MDTISEPAWQFEPPRHIRNLALSARFIDVVPWRPGGLAAIASFVATAFRLVRFPTHIFAPVRGHPAALGFSASFPLDLKFALLLVLFRLHRIGWRMRWTVLTWISAPWARLFMAAVAGLISMVRFHYLSASRLPSLNDRMNKQLSILLLIY